MPLYDFRCGECGLAQTRLFRSFEASQDAACEACGGKDMERLVAAVAFHRSLSSIHEAAGEPKGPGDMSYYSDPRNIGRNAETAAAKMGYELPNEIRTMIDSARDGELPASIKDV